MTSLHTYHSIDVESTPTLRRSDRKKTKKIIKDDFLLPNPFKGKHRKQKSLKLPSALDTQIKRIQYLTEKTLAMLNYGNNGFSHQMLSEMKQAVCQQQNRLSELFQIKLIGVKNIQENRSCQNLDKIAKSHPEKENTPKIQENTQTDQMANHHEFHKEITGIATAQEIYINYQDMENDQDDKISAFDQESEFCIMERPKFRKESSKLLSDNYQNNQLLYTLDHMIPSWCRDEELHQQHEFLD